MTAISVYFHTPTGQACAGAIAQHLADLLPESLERPGLRYGQAITVRPALGAPVVWWVYRTTSGTRIARECQTAWPELRFAPEA